MESGILGIDVAPDSSLKPVSVAGERRRAWAQSKDSVGQGSRPEHCGPQGPKQSPSNGDIQRDAEEQGSVPNKISSWLTECRTPLAASLDDQSSSPNRGALRNGCSFEDDLSLGAEANHLQSSKSPSESCFGLAAEQKRNQFKERGRSMNSTGSGKSSTVSSVSELLDLYEEDPEEILLNLGFGQEEPDLSSKIPSRFFNNTSSARGIDIKVYLAAQLQRMELENPNFALTSRFRQIEVLTTVANEFFQLYSQVSGQPVQRISSKDQSNQGVEGGEGSDQAPPLKRTNSALNVAKFLKKTISRHNLLGSSSESPEACPSKLNGSAGGSDHTGTNGHAAEDGSGNYPDHQVEPLGQKHVRRKDNFSLATVTEETSTDGDVDRLMDNSPKHGCSEAQHQPQSADLQPTNPRTGEGGLQVNQEENNFTSTPEKTLSSRSPPQLAQLRSENTDSFDMEEIQTNEDEVLRSGPSRTTDLSRTVSQQSDSSGFAEEPSLGSYSHLKVQESYDSCDSETTVTSHPSQDVATPLALDQPAFELPVSREEEPGAAEADGSSEPGPWSTDLHDNGPSGVQQSLLTTEARTEQTWDSAQTPEPEHIQNQSSASELEPAETLLSSDPPAEEAEDQDQGREPLTKESGSPCPPVPTSPVLRALNRAKQNQSVRLGQPASPQANNPVLELRQRRRGVVPLQRSSSLPSSLLSPSRVVSSVRIQFGPGQASCTPPQYSYRYTETTEEEEDESCLSTLIINPGSGPVPPAPVPAGPVPTKPVHATPVPRYLLRPSYSLQSCSPPPDHCPAWSTQSVPDLSSSQALLGPVQQNYHNQQIWNSPAMCSDPSPPTSSPFPLPQNPQSPALTPFSSLTSLHQPPPPPPSTGLTYLQHQPPSFSHPGTPTIHHLGYNFPHSHQSPYPAASPSPQLLPPYHSYHGYSTNPYITSPPSISQYPLLTSEHNVHAVLTPPSGVLPSPGPGPGHYPAPGPGYYPSSTEMQLRRVLHEIRGTVQSLNQNRVDTPDGFMDHRGSADCLQSLAEFQQRRRSLNMFRSQMMDLELSIARQHALVYKHLSPADRLEAEQLQSLRSAVREELQELEQQLEDRLLEVTHRHRAHHRRSSIGSLSTSSALKAMEPMSDLLREQFFLQSELAYASQAPSTDPSTRSSSPVREGASGGKQRRGVYRATVNITPAAPPRAHTHPGHLKERGGGLLEERGGGLLEERGGGLLEERGGGLLEERGGGPLEERRGGPLEERRGGPLEERRGGPLEERRGGPLEERRVGPLEERTSRHLEERGRHPEEEPTPGGFRGENFQQLIREIRESVAQEVRREIYSELLAAASPQGSPHPARHPPL